MPKTSYQIRIKGFVENYGEVNSCNEITKKELENLKPLIQQVLNNKKKSNWCTYSKMATVKLKNGEIKHTPVYLIYNEYKTIPYATIELFMKYIPNGFSNAGVSKISEVEIYKLTKVDLEKI